MQRELRRSAGVSTYNEKVLAERQQDASEEGGSEKENGLPVTEAQDMEVDVSPEELAQEMAVDSMHAKQQRAVRQKYRQLLERTQELMENREYQTTQEMLQTVSSANNLFNKVKTTSDATLDAKLLMNSAEMGSAMARQNRNELQLFDIQEFVKSMLVRFETTQSDGFTMRNWKDLSALAYKYSNTASCPEFMLGPLDTESKKRVATQRPKREKAGPDVVATKAEDLTQEELNVEKSETTRNIMNVFKALNETGPTPYWKFVINPHSFSQSIENIFCVAFLVKDGKVCLYEDESLAPGDAMIGALEVIDAETGAVDHSKRHQYMVSISYEEWKEMITKYDITESCIPDRPPAKDAEHDRFVYCI